MAQAKGDSIYKKYTKARQPAKPSNPATIYQRQAQQRAQQEERQRAQRAEMQRERQRAQGTGELSAEAKNQRLYDRWRQVRAEQANKPQQISDPMVDSPYMTPEDEARRARWAQAYAGRMNAQVGGGPKKEGEIFGVHYGTNWRRGEWTPPPDWRMGQYANMQMTNEEYQRRRRAMEPRLQPGYQEWLDSARQANGGRELYTYRIRPDGSREVIAGPGAWRAANPRPAGFYQLEQERILRQNAAPTGFRYVPYGSSYEQIPTQRSGNQGGAGSNGGGGSSGGGWGGWDDWGGGGGGGGYTPYEEPKNFWNNFLNWRVLEVQGG